MKINKLDSVFNPADFGIVYPQDQEEEQLLDENKKKVENELYNEVITGLKSDMSRLGIEDSYSSEILLREIAMNILLMNRIKTQIICRGLLRNKKIFKPEYISMTKEPIAKTKESKTFYYDTYISAEEEIHPLFENFIPKLQKQINEGLKQLGLLPQQQVERQKVILVEKLKKRLISLDSDKQSYTADVIIEKKNKI